MNMATKTPQVSVVMSVYDQPEEVRSTIESILCQQGVELELIVISDGASNEVKSVLVDFQDDRLIVHYCENKGLTKALIYGCKEARSNYIARIDSGDIMLSGRLEKQVSMLDSDDSVVMVSSYVEMRTPEGYFLYEIRDSGDELCKSLRSTNPEKIKTPFHSSVVFRKTTYMSVGGYRSQFYFTQDCDLWARMVRHGRIEVIEKILTQGVFSASGLSGRYAHIQRLLKEVVAKLNTETTRVSVSKSESMLLKRAEDISQLRFCTQDALSGSQEGLYFIASVLTKNKSEGALKYWKLYLKQNPWNLKAHIKALWCSVSNLA